jgi:hypothetical protein
MSNLVTTVARFNYLSEAKCSRCLRSVVDCDKALADKEELRRHCEASLEAWRAEFLKKAQQ